MEPADGVVSDAVITRRDPWRGALIGVGTAIAVGLLVLLAPSPANADDGSTGGSLGGLVSELTGTVEQLVTEVVTPIVEPVVEPLPAVRELPLVGDVVGGVVDSRPVQSVTEPIAGTVDGLLGETVASLPVVGELLGDRPIGSILDPVAGVVDGTLDEVLTVGDRSGAVVVPPTPHPSIVAQAAPAIPSAAPAIVVSALPAITVAVDLGERTTVAIGTAVGGNPLFAGGVGDSASAVSAGSSATALALVVMGAGLLALLFAGRVRPHALRAPPSPTYDTDSSPD